MSTQLCVRKYERVTFLCRVALSSGPGLPSVETSSVDISLGGVGLISPKIVPKGGAVTLSFHLRGAGQTQIVEQVQGRVVHVRSDFDGHRLGIEFDEPLARGRNPHLCRKVENL
jgi:c-di-GMP-binding flagellar brake protein YcgR